MQNYNAYLFTARFLLNRFCYNATGLAVSLPVFFYYKTIDITEDNNNASVLGTATLLTIFPVTFASSYPYLVRSLTISNLNKFSMWRGIYQGIVMYYSLKVSSTEDMLYGKTFEAGVMDALQISNLSNELFN